MTRTSAIVRVKSGRRIDRDEYNGCEAVARLLSAPTLRAHKAELLEKVKRKAQKGYGSGIIEELESFGKR
jgi:hypothetical protein